MEYIKYGICYIVLLNTYNILGKITIDELLN